MAPNHFNIARVWPVYIGPPKPESLGAVQTFRSETAHENRLPLARCLGADGRARADVLLAGHRSRNQEVFRPALHSGVADWRFG